VHKTLAPFQTRAARSPSPAARPWAEAGFACWCVDFQHSIRRDREERVGAGVIRYVWGDVRSWRPPERPDFLMAFPPCTHVAVSGARDFKKKGLRLLSDALDVFNACDQAAAWSFAPYFIENPVGVLSSHVRKPDHLFDPCDYAGYLAEASAEAFTKKTCIWSGNGFVMPAQRTVVPTLGSMMHLMPPSEDRADLRAVTPAGFSRAVFQANAPRLLERGAA
jgi:hypothetical protein